MPVRMLLVSAEYPPTPGGVGDYTALLAAHLVAAGATVSVLTSGSDGIERDGPVTIYRRVPRWGWAIADVVHDVVRSTRPDVIHLQYQTGMYGMHPAVNFLPDRLSWYVPVLHVLHAEVRWDFRFVTTFHDLLHPYLFPKAGPLRTFVTRHLADASNTAIATNGADVATLRMWGVDAALIPIGSNIPAARDVDGAAVRVRYGISSDATLLTTFGLLNHSKGIDAVIDALAALRQEGMNAHLLLVGAGIGANDATNRATEAALDAAATAKGVSAAITRTGTLPADAVAAALAASDLCLLPYRDGASPRRGSLLAALAQGIPVVTTTPAPGVYDGLPEPRDGETALFVASGDGDVLTAAVRRVLNDPRLAARLRSGGAAYAAQFTWPAIAEQTLAIYAALGLSVSVPGATESLVAGVER